MDGDSSQVRETIGTVSWLPSERIAEKLNLKTRFTTKYQNKLGDVQHMISLV